ncbi:rRNA processing/ribosome biogenesis-domain-containing protein [Circinella umbellata]|nr:rRNA processing/ribosome biogenesis-domain-containing protein [Circinella umbellata]
MTTVTLQLSRILNDYLADESRVSNFLPFILEAINNNNLLIDQHNEQDDASILKRKWTVRLNALLASKQVSTRWAAISLIKETCQQSESLYINGVQSWTSQLLGILAKPETNMILTLTIETLCILFEKTIGKTELHNEITVKSLPRFNQLLLSTSRNSQLMPVTFTALSKNIELFPTMSRNIMDQILKLYISCLDNDETDVSPFLLGRCLATGCRTSTKTNYATQWQETLMKLVGSIHQALDRLFDTIDEEEDTVSNRVSGYPLSATPPDYVESFPVLLRRIRYIQDTIAAYLSLKTMVPVGVPIGHLMKLCCRIYNVYQGCVMKEYKPKDEYACLMTCLPELHLSTNKLLASLLLSADIGMVQYAKLLARILLRLLSENNKKRAVKISVYSLISLCMQKFGYAFADTILKAVITSAIGDLKAIEQKKVDVVLSNKKTSGKKRRAEQISSDAFSTQNSILYQPCDIQIAALETLYNMMTLHGNSMDLGLRTSIDTIIVSRILQSATMNDNKQEGSLDVKCYLYKCLLSSVMSPNINQASLLPHAIRLFNGGLNDETHELRVICAQGLAICDLCMHTRMPPIQRVQPMPAPTSTTENSTMPSIINNDNTIDDVGEEEEEEEEEQQQQPIDTTSSTATTPIMSKPSNVIRAPEIDDEDEIMVENNQQESNNTDDSKSHMTKPIVAPSASSSPSTSLTTNNMEDTKQEATFSFTSESFVSNDSKLTTTATEIATSFTTTTSKINNDIEDDDDDEEFEIPEINMDDDE